MPQPFFEAASVAVLGVWSHLFVLHLLGYVSASLCASALFQGKDFYAPGFFLEGNLFCPCYWSWAGSLFHYLFKLTAFSVQPNESSINHYWGSNPLKIYIYIYINGTVVTLATLFCLWWSASVVLEFCMGLLCSGGSWVSERLLCRQRNTGGC